MIRVKDYLTSEESRIIVFICLVVFLGFAAKYIAVQNSEELTQAALADSTSSARIDIRIADKSELMSLPDIGEVKAVKILEYRREKQFENTMELMKVKGIGPKTMEKILPWLVLFGEMEKPVLQDSISADVLTDINSAEIAELILLPGIGEVKAKRIIDRREKLGKYRSVDELLEIKGIGEKTLAKLKPLIKCER